MKFDNILESLNLQNYSEKELEILATRFCNLLFKHLAMIKYQPKGLKMFDFTVNELANLCGIASRLVEGIKKGVSIEDFRLDLIDFMDEINKITVLSSPTNSIKKDLRNAIMIEIKTFVTTVKEQPNFWNL